MMSVMSHTEARTSEVYTKGVERRGLGSGRTEVFSGARLVGCPAVYFCVGHLAQQNKVTQTAPTGSAGSPTTLTPQIYIYAKSFTKVTGETPHRLTLRVFVIWALPHPQVHGCKGGKPEDGITELFRQHNRGRIGVSIGHKGHN